MGNPDRIFLHVKALFRGCIKSLFTAETQRRRDPSDGCRDILLYFNALRSSAVFLGGSLRLNFSLWIQPRYLRGTGVKTN